MIKQIKHFNELSRNEVYQMLQLRMEVFIMEQDCHYMDCDDKDLLAHHLLYWDENVLVAYCRLLPEGVSYEGYCSIGRVATKATHRRQGLGIELMQEAIQFCKQQFQVPIKISAQSYLEKFYSDFGFVVVTEEYLEDDIPHKGMKLA